MRFFKVPIHAFLGVLAIGAGTLSAGLTLVATARHHDLAGHAAVYCAILAAIACAVALITGLADRRRATRRLQAVTRPHQLLSIAALGLQIGAAGLLYTATRSGQPSPIDALVVGSAWFVLAASAITGHRLVSVHRVGVEDHGIDDAASSDDDASDHHTAA